MATRQEWYTVNDDEAFVFTTAAIQKAQTFTLGTTGNNLTFNITQVKVRIGQNAGAMTGNSSWEIQGVEPDGSPDGVTLSTGTLDMSLLGSATWHTITMTSVTLQANQQYALVCTDGFDNGTDVMYWRADGTSPSYTGGSMWESSDTGATWTVDATTDFMFQIEGGTYAGTLCTLAEAVNKAGTNASSGGTEEILVSDYVKQAEGVINAVTRFNWIGAYSTLTEDVKNILNQTASDLAAIYIITYDMSAYTADTVEAETMLNIYREAVARGLSLLRNQEVKRFMTSDT